MHPRTNTRGQGSWQTASKLVLLVALFGAIVGGLATTAKAQTPYYFDPSPGAGFGANASFTWDTSLIWNSDASGNNPEVAWPNASPGNNAILGSGTGSGSYTATLGTNITAGTITSTLGTWNIALGSNTLTFDLSGSFTLGLPISGTGSIVKNNSGALTLAGSNYSGGTTINAGILRFDGSNTNVGAITVNSGGTLQIGFFNSLPSSTAITLAGGALQLPGAFSQFGLGALTVTGNSTLDFGAGISTSQIYFGDSSAQSWSGTLTILNFKNTGSDLLQFGNSSTALTPAQLALIDFAGIPAQIDAGGSVTPVPEPAFYAALAGLAMFGAVILRRSRPTVQEAHPAESASN